MLALSSMCFGAHVIDVIDRIMCDEDICACIEEESDVDCFYFLVCLRDSDKKK